MSHLFSFQEIESLNPLSQLKSSRDSAGRLIRNRLALNPEMMSPGDYEWKDVERFLDNVGLGGQSQGKQEMFVNELI